MFEATTSNSGEEVVVTVKGDVDLEVAPKRWTAIESALKQSLSLKIRLSDVQFIDSSGIAMLLKGFKYAKDQSIDYAILDPSPRVTKVMELAALHTLFTIERSA